MLGLGEGPAAARTRRRRRRGRRQREEPPPVPRHPQGGVQAFSHRRHSAPRSAARARRRTRGRGTAAGRCLAGTRRAATPAAAAYAGRGVALRRVAEMRALVAMLGGGLKSFARSIGLGLGLSLDCRRRDGAVELGAEELGHHPRRVLADDRTAAWSRVAARARPSSTARVARPRANACSRSAAVW